MNRPRASSDALSSSLAAPQGGETPPRLCGCGYRTELHDATSEGSVYCQLARERHKANVADDALLVCQQEREKADAALAELWGTTCPDCGPEDYTAIAVHVLGELDRVQAALARCHQELERERRAHGETIDQRDRAESAADDLAYAIAPQEIIGEHSNMNNPWANAVDELEAERERHKRCDTCRRLQEKLTLNEQDHLSALARCEGQIRHQHEALTAARDALAAFGKQAGYLPEQGGYSTRMTDAEHKLAQAVADLTALLASREDKQDRRS